MSKKAKIILVTTITATVLTSTAVTATLIICNKIYRKTYFSAD